MRVIFSLFTLLSVITQTTAINLVEAVVDLEDLAYLETAVTAAGLVPTLSGEGPFT